MAILKYLSILSLPFILCGCYEDFNPTVDTKPVLCMNSIIYAGEPINVKLSHTWNFNDPIYEKNHGVDDAELHIYVNGELAPEDYIAAEGDEIRILAESAKYGKAEATVRVPYAVPLTSAKMTNEVIDEIDEPWNEMKQIIFNSNVLLTVDDDASADNYFRLGYYASYPSSNDDPDEVGYCFYQHGSFDYHSEPIFKEHIGVFEAVVNDYISEMVFSDRQFSGKSYTLDINFNRADFGVSTPIDERFLDCNLHLVLYTISRSYYDFYLYVWQRDMGSVGDLGNLGFAEPLWGYSNVSTGAGVVVASSSYTVTISLRDFLKSALNYNE